MKQEEKKQGDKKRLQIPVACAYTRRVLERRVVLPFCSQEEIDMRAKTVTSVLEKILTQPVGQ